MGKFCANCGKELPENSNVCPNCGVFIEKDEIKEVEKVEQIVNNTKVKIPGNGMSIAGMILGIIAAVWAFFQILSVGSVEPAINEMLDINRSLGTPSFILFWFSFGYTVFSLIPSLIGLPLSIAGLIKHKSGKNITGIILNIIALGVSVFMFVYIMSLA